MYVVKVLHGYIGKDGRRTREKIPDKLWILKIGSSRKPLQQNRRKSQTSHRSKAKSIKSKTAKRTLTGVSFIIRCLAFYCYRFC